MCPISTAVSTRNAPPQLGQPQPVSLANVPGYQKWWQGWLQQQAANQQQTAQMLHQLGPWGNNPLSNGTANAQQMQMMQYLMGQQGGSSLAPPNPTG